MRQHCINYCACLIDIVTFGVSFKLEIFSLVGPVDDAPET